MKRTIGWILLVIAGLNFVTLFVNLSQNKSIGSPAYLIILVMMFFGGLSLVNSKKKTTESSTEIQKTDDD